MKELRDYRRWAWNCFRDSMCKHVFPWHTKNPDYYQICPSLMKYRFDGYAAQGKMDIARALIEGEIEWSDKILEIIYADPLCGACDYICGRVKEMQPGRIIQAMRAQALHDGQTPPGGFGELLLSLREYLNPYKKYNGARLNWINKLPSNLEDSIVTTGKTKTLLFAGCFPMHDQASENIARNAVELLSRSGINFGVLGERERCCGNPSLRLGDNEQFIAFARENIRLFNEMGVAKLVTICPFCYSTFKRDYPEVGEKMNFEVVHILPMVAELIREGQIKLSKRIRLNATYHDPCHLGRLGGHGISGTGAFSGIYDEPRQIINAIPDLEIVEMPRNKDDALCCGGGGWLTQGYPELAGFTAKHRVSEAKATGAEALITFCPHCEQNLSLATDDEEYSMKVYDLLDLVVQAIE